MARICARCRQPLDGRTPADHDCPEDDDLDLDPDGSSEDEAPDAA